VMKAELTCSVGGRPRIECRAGRKGCGGVTDACPEILGQAAPGPCDVCSLPAGAVRARGGTGLALCGGEVRVLQTERCIHERPRTERDCRQGASRGRHDKLGQRLAA
jgi:hypothetical protein